MADELTIRMAVEGSARVDAALKSTQDKITGINRTLGLNNAQFKATGQTLNQFGNIAARMGNVELAGFINQIEGSVSAIKQMNQELGKSKLAVGALAVGAVVAGASAGNYLRQFIPYFNEPDKLDSAAKANLRAMQIAERINALKNPGSSSTASELAAIDQQINEIKSKEYGPLGVRLPWMAPSAQDRNVIFQLERLKTALQERQEDAELEKGIKIMQKLRRAQIEAGMGVNVRGALAEYDAVQEANANKEEIENLKLTEEQKRLMIEANERILRARQSNIQDANRPAPFGFSENMLANIEATRKQFDDMGKVIADTLNNTIGTAINSISQQFTQLILGAQTWGETLRNVGLSIVTEVIQSIIRMGVTWVLQHTIMKAASIALETTRTAVAVTGAATRTGAAITEAGAEGVATATKAAGSVAKIPYVGWALAIAAFAGVIAMVASASKGFASGGFTGTGGTGQVAGVVHGQEFVFSAPAVQAVGLGNLQAMHESAVRGGGGAVGGGNINVAFISSIAERREWLRKDPEVRKIVIDMVTGAKQEIGVA